MRLLLSIGVVAVLSSVAAAQPLTIPAGPDLFVTEPGSPPDNGTWADFAGAPPGFFGINLGMPSDPVPPGRLFLKGEPTGAMGNEPTPNFMECEPEPFDENALLAEHGLLGDARENGGLAMTDTIVMRQAPAVMPTVGSSDTVPIEIVSLSLKSVAPIMVTYGGGASSQFFDVFVDLAPLPQTPGTMTLTRETQNGGTFDSVLPVLSRITFENVNTGGPEPQQPVIREDVFTSTDVCWEVPEPSSLILAGLAFPWLLLRVRREVN